EVINAVLALSEDSEITLAELMEHVPGPDFSTRGLTVGKSGIRNAYESGRGSIIMRARCANEDMKTGKEVIVVPEGPNQPHKTLLDEEIEELGREKKIEGIEDLTNERRVKEGVKIIIEIRKDKSGNGILNNLY